MKMNQASVEGKARLVMRWPGRGSSTLVAEDDAVMVLCEPGLGWVSEGVSRYSFSVEAATPVSSERGETDGC